MQAVRYGGVNGQATRQVKGIVSMCLICVWQAITSGKNALDQKSYTTRVKYLGANTVVGSGKKAQGRQATTTDQSAKHEVIT